jgi:hypothetical protein
MCVSGYFLFQYEWGKGNKRRDTMARPPSEFEIGKTKGNKGNCNLFEGEENPGGISKDKKREKHLCNK